MFSIVQLLRYKTDSVKTDCAFPRVQTNQHEKLF